MQGRRQQLKSKHGHFSFCAVVDGRVVIGARNSTCYLSELRKSYGQFANSGEVPPMPIAQVGVRTSTQCGLRPTCLRRVLTFIDFASWKIIQKQRISWGMHLFQVT